MKTCEVLKNKVKPPGETLDAIICIFLKVKYYTRTSVLELDFHAMKTMEYLLLIGT